MIVNVEFLSSNYLMLMNYTYNHTKKPDLFGDSELHFKYHIW